MKVYVASSWRNELQPEVVRAIRAAGHEVYDFRHPEPGNDGFHWSAIDPDWKGWDADQFRTALDHPVAESGFRLDMTALASADATVLVLPCGRSAHLELGFAVGCEQATCALLVEGEPELMYKMVDHLATSIADVLDFLNRAAEAMQ